MSQLGRVQVLLKYINERLVFSSKFMLALIFQELIEWYTALRMAKLERLLLGLQKLNISEVTVL